MEGGGTVCIRHLGELSDIQHSGAWPDSHRRPEMPSMKKAAHSLEGLAGLREQHTPYPLQNSGANPSAGKSSGAKVKKALQRASASGPASLSLGLLLKHPWILRASGTQGGYGSTTLEPVAGPSYSPPQTLE